MDINIITFVLKEFEEYHELPNKAILCMKIGLMCISSCMMLVNVFVIDVSCLKESCFVHGNWATCALVFVWPW